MSEQSPICRIMEPGGTDMASATVPQVDGRQDLLRTKERTMETLIDSESKASTFPAKPE